MASQDRLSVEALLFASGKAMHEEQIALFTGLDKKKVKRTLKELKEDYDKRETSLKIYENNKTWRMMVRDDYIPLVKKIISNAELSRATMETLAVIAFKYPKIQQSEVIHIRGTTAYDQIKELLELGFITRQKEGRSFTIRLTEKFFEYFDVEGEKDIKDVFKNVEVPKPAEKQKQLGELGDLEVIEISKEEQKKIEEKKKSLGLEVVDFDETKENQEEQSSFQDELVSKKEVDQEEENGFLAKIEKQIDELSKKNDEHDADESLKRDDSEEMKEGVEKAPEETSEEISEETKDSSEEAEIPEELGEDSDSEKKEEKEEAKEKETEEKP